MAAGVRKSEKAVAFDGDKLGHVAGSVVALAVVAIQAFYRDSDPLTTLTRAGWTFVGVYAAVFFLTRIMLRAVLRAMIEEKRRRREEIRKRRQEARDRAAEMGLGPPVPPEAVPEAEETAERPG